MQLRLRLGRKRPRGWLHARDQLGREQDVTQLLGTLGHARPCACLEATACLDELAEALSVRPELNGRAQALSHDSDGHVMA